MSRERVDMVDQAIGWHLRLADAPERDWRDFTDWLAGSPAHAAAYDRIAMDDLLVGLAAQAGATATVPGPVAAVAAETFPADGRPARRWRRHAAGALAAAAAIVVAVTIPASHRPATAYVVATAPGEHRVVTLADGTRIDLNGDTRITLDRARPRAALLDAGQAVFHVRHDAGVPFEVRTAGVALRDLGTVFEVTRDERRLDVRVAAGAVLFRPDREAIALGPGMALAKRDGEDRPVLGRVAVAEVGGWRAGRLSFGETRLRTVARAVARTTGVRLDVAPALADRPFTGSFRLTGRAERDIPHVAALAGATCSHRRQGWLLTP